MNDTLKQKTVEINDDRHGIYDEKTAQLVLKLQC